MRKMWFPKRERWVVLTAAKKAGLRDTIHVCCSVSEFRLVNYKMRANQIIIKKTQPPLGAVDETNAQRT